MSDLLVPVGRHFFTPQDLTRMVATLPPDLSAPGSQGGALAGVDQDGVHVAVLFTPKQGRVVIRGAFEHDWTGDNKVAGDVLFRF